MRICSRLAVATLVAAAIWDVTLVAASTVPSDDLEATTPPAVADDPTSPECAAIHSILIAAERIDANLEGAATDDVHRANIDQIGRSYDVLADADPGRYAVLAKSQQLYVVAAEAVGWDLAQIESSPEFAEFEAFYDANDLAELEHELESVWEDDCGFDDVANRRVAWCAAWDRYGVATDVVEPFTDGAEVDPADLEDAYTEVVATLDQLEAFGELDAPELAWADIKAPWLGAYELYAVHDWDHEAARADPAFTANAERHGDAFGPAMSEIGAFMGHECGTDGVSLGSLPAESTTPAPTTDVTTTAA